MLQQDIKQRSNSYLSCLMEIICTTCCREKVIGNDLMAALDRYLSPRIRHVYDESRATGLPFRILSGKYGLLSPESPIPWYDKKLGSDDVALILPAVTDQLTRENICKIRFYRRDLPDWTPYTELMRKACEKTGIVLEEYLVTVSIPE